MIVPATNRPHTLARCTAAIERGRGPDELIVVTEPHDANPARARNIGAARATGDVLLFVDADVELHPDAVDRVRHEFDVDPELAALFGSYDDAPEAPGIVSAFRNLLHHHVHQSAPGPAKTFWTGLGAVTREAFEEVGGFDERLDWLEDIDLGMRLAAARRPIRLVPTIQGTHLKAWSVWTMVKTDFIGRGVPWVQLLLRHRGSATALNLGWRHRLSALASVAAVVLVARRHLLGAAAAGAALVALNRPFYRLLHRRRGPAEAGAGVVLHALHHLTGVAAVPVGLVRHLLDRREGDGP